LRCYEEALRTNPALDGKLTYRITLQKHGCISWELVGREFKEPKLEECIAKILANIRFENAPRKATVFRYSALFMPENATE
jgi:hypothetical protein